jgi:hypothetical protein
VALPSGSQVVFVIWKLYRRVTPVFGHLVSKSVAILNPLLQHCRVKGVFLQEASTALEVAEAKTAEDATDDGGATDTLAWRLS